MRDDHPRIRQLAEIARVLGVSIESLAAGRSERFQLGELLALWGKLATDDQRESALTNLREFVEDARRAPARPVEA